MKVRVYRQGDVLLVSSKIPPGAKLKPRFPRGVVLAEGEATGHYHAITARGVKEYEHEGTRWIRVPRRTKLKHLGYSGPRDHDAVVLEADEYEVRIQRQYTPEAIRRVTD